MTALQVPLRSSWVGLLPTLMVVCAGACASHPSAGSDGAGGTGGASPPGVVLGGHELVAEIHLSASSNSRAIDVAVYADASAEQTLGQWGPLGAVDRGPVDNVTTVIPPGSAVVVAFLQALAEVKDLAALPTLGVCPGSISFRTATTVVANGQTSVNLQCIDSKSDAGTVAEGQALNDACNALLAYP